MPRKYIRKTDGTPQERFEEYISMEPNTGCWLYIGAWDGHGYGNAWRDGKWIRAHRLAYELYIGPIPDGVNLLHHCDTPACCSPYHTFLGTQVDNLLDCVKKGRKNPAIKLTDEIVAIIRSRTVRAKDLVARYGISRGTIYDIRLRKSWKHLP